MIADMVGKQRRVRTMSVPMSSKPPSMSGHPAPSLGVHAQSHQQGRADSCRSPERLGSVEHRHRASWAPRSAPHRGEALPEERRERGAIKQILGHASIVTTGPYLGSGKEIAAAVNDNLGI